MTKTIHTSCDVTDLFYILGMISLSFGLLFCATCWYLLLEGCWFDSPGLHVKVSMGKKLNPKLVCTLHGGQHHQCMNDCKSLWMKAPAKCPECKNDGIENKWTNVLLIIQPKAKWLKAELLKVEWCSSYERKVKFFLSEHSSILSDDQATLKEIHGIFCCYI